MRCELEFLLSRWRSGYDGNEIQEGGMVVDVDLGWTSVSMH